MDASPSWRVLLAPLLFILACGCAPPVEQEKTTERAPLAIRGYDVVAYFGLEPGAEGVPGMPKFEYVWDEHRYRFASARNMAAFKKNPVQYAPRFGNVCASALAYGFTWDADPDNWRILDGRLYVFGNAASRDEFDQDPQGVISAAGRNDERLRKDEKPMPEKALSAGGRAFLEQVIAEGQRILDNQPVNESAPLKTGAAPP